jgi:phosphatidylinositol-binding clathrin assembly protein
LPGHYFEMSRTDAERALRIYKTFVERTNEVIEYLSEAKSLEHVMGLQIPNVKHVGYHLLSGLTIGTHGFDDSVGGVSE